MRTLANYTSERTRKSSPKTPKWYRETAYLSGRDESWLAPRVTAFC